MQIGDYAVTFNGISGKITKLFYPTCRPLTVHIKTLDNRVYYCPISDIIKYNWYVDIFYIL